MDKEIIEIKGKQAGPISVILVGIHGNEKSGVEAVSKLLPSLEIENGILFIVCANPKAIEEDKRFIDVNLNRIFKPDALLTEKEKKSYEYGRAQIIKMCLDRADACLDVHASLTTNSRPFAICEENAKKISDYLPVGLVVSGFDKLEPGATDSYMNNSGKIGICLESGYTKDPNSVQVAEQSILNFLRAMGHVKGEDERIKQKNIHMYDLYKTKTENFNLAKDFNDFEEIKAGQAIGSDGPEEIRAGKDCVILFARNREGIGEEAFLVGEYK